MHIFGTPLLFLENILGIASDSVDVVIDDVGNLIPEPSWWQDFMHRRVAHYDSATGRFV